MVVRARARGPMNGRQPMVNVMPTAASQGKPRYYLVLGGLLNNDFIDELNQLTGLTSRLYYREGARFFDVFTHPGQVKELKELSKEAMRHMVKDKKPNYSKNAEGEAQTKGSHRQPLGRDGRPLQKSWFYDGNLQPSRRYRPQRP